MLYIITSGEYSDYTIVAVLETDEHQDIKTLYSEFEEVTGRPSDELPGYTQDEQVYKDHVAAVESWRIRMTEAYCDKVWIWPEKDPSLEVFVGWLIEDQGFRPVPYKEVNFDND